MDGLPRIDVTSDWRARHPFLLGMTVWPRVNHRYPSLIEGRRIVMRGESERGLWIALEGIAYEFPADDFTHVMLMPQVVDATGEEAA